MSGFDTERFDHIAVGDWQHGYEYGLRDPSGYVWTGNYNMSHVPQPAVRVRRAIRWGGWQEDAAPSVQTGEQP